jgi:hypothetical protein
MSNWDNFKKKPLHKDLHPLSVKIDGVFTCQMCPLEVEEADYFVADGVLKWKCAEGHLSFAENFRLG